MPTFLPVRRPREAAPPPAPRGRTALAWHRHGRWLTAAAVLALLAQMAVGMLTAATQQTPTIDEPVYAGTALVYVREHSLRFNPEHPPLGKLIVASGEVFARPHLTPGFDGDQGALGRRLLYESGNDPWRVMFWARLPVIVLTLLFGLVVFAFARDLTGSVGGLAALALYAFSPDLIAHGSLATLDVPAVGFVLVSVWAVWRARDRPLPYLPLAGPALGAALATKMNTLPALPVVLGLAAWSYATARRPSAQAPPVTGPRARLRPLLRAAGAAVGVGLLAVAVVWAAYLAVDPGLRRPAAHGVPEVHGLRGLLVRALPFPEPYRDGMRIQFGFEDKPWQGFLFGHVYTGNRWYYLPAALLVKTPLGMLALWLLGAAAMLVVPRLRAAAPYVLLPPAVLLVVAMDGARDFGTRYALFMPLFLAVAGACVLATRRRWAYGAVAVLVAFVAVSSLRTYPFYLPYSNEAFGGPAKTRLRLHDANVDWGQDLGRLADRLRERYPGERVWLVYKGSGVPSWYGIDAADPRKVRPARVRGLLVMSDSSVAKARGRLALLLRSSREVDEVGHSITLFRR
ncbi:ArnT family glycosyltransferase [Streptomyces sp. NBC_00670]|uniref:ArnT family glycosyltransferase n=1 Tax=Streptomyces sp. NBC_00670 TaxID=2975804 RepID=UPI003FA7AE82